MKKLTSAYPEHRLLRSRGNSRGKALVEASDFTVFAASDYTDASVPRIYDRPRRTLVNPDELPDNVVRFTTLRNSRRKA